MIDGARFGERDARDEEVNDHIRECFAAPEHGDILGLLVRQYELESEPVGSTGAA